ncbi:MAG: hypothetical protein R2844_03535 [Caldilineales bacterium]
MVASADLATLPDVPDAEYIEAAAFGFQELAGIGLDAIRSISAPMLIFPEFVCPDQEPWRAEDFLPLSEEELAKLEVYCFANCANTMKYIRADGPQPIPYIESFGNENDLVARLGMLAPRREARGIDIDGPCFMKPGGWGHLLNAHYLIDVEKRQKRGRKPGGAGTSAPYVPMHTGTAESDETPRLFGYINGGEPATTR